MEIVDGLPDGFINLPPGQMIASLASLVMTKLPKYNLDADAIKYVVRGDIKNPLTRINKFIEDEEEASRKPPDVSAISPIVNPREAQIADPTTLANLEILARINNLRRLGNLPPPVNISKPNF